MATDRPPLALVETSLRAPRFRVLPPLTLYVHLPWCVKKCPYCDFNSHESRGDIPEEAYVDALIADLDTSVPAVWGRKVITMFIGGGTPSLFSPKAIDRMLSEIRSRVFVAPDAEITMEANPGTFEREKFEGYFAAGINRLSLGVQSFDSRFLHALGRIHDGDEARRAAEAAMTIFGNVNLDLMYALPRQTMDDLHADLVAALSFSVPHISYYHLTLEPNTLFHRHPPPQPDDDTAAEMGDAVEKTLVGAGYYHYETSAYARLPHESRHNLNYWRFGDYLGIGAGAHSKLSFADAILRQMRWKNPRDYLERAPQGAPVQEELQVTRDDVGFEFMLNALRLAEGVPTSIFAERTGFPLSIVARQIEVATRKGLLEPDPAVLKATELGRRFLNDLQQLFLPPAKPGSKREVAPLVRIEATGVQR
ncbi:MAG TPA: radical SAM family heme chaperone HemW [Casimicrobiaceae bacterium]